MSNTYGTGSSSSAQNPFANPHPPPGYTIPAQQPLQAAGPQPYTTIPIGTQGATTGNMAGVGASGGNVMGRPQIDTLDEAVSVTIMRDLKSIAAKLKQVLLPAGDNKNILRACPCRWARRGGDLWGPLLLCLALSIRLSITFAKPENMFTAIFVIVWCGAGVVTLNSKLLGGKM
ncbi:Yip1 member 6 [Rhizophlyctis rosea]|nr:Yip1 member 6 [Rhizophlyctis rosea]